MEILDVKSTFFPEIKLIRYRRFPDERGFFTESFRKSDLQKQPALNSFNGSEVLQSNTSYSIKGVVRGLHFQWQPNMGKLIRVIDGAMIDLFLDIRKNSPNFGCIDGVKLSAKPNQTDETMVWIPPGFAHGAAFLENSYIEYYCTAEYSPKTEAGIYPLAEDIDWSNFPRELKDQIDELFVKPIISAKDQKGLTVSAWKADPRSNYGWGVGIAG